MTNLFKKIGLFLSLFTSTTTLVCCALPALLVSLGAGAVFASLTSYFPQLIWIAERKKSLFIIAGLLILISGYVEFRMRKIDCDINAAKICHPVKRWRKWVWFLSVVTYGIGFLFAFILPVLLGG